MIRYINIEKSKTESQEEERFLWSIFNIYKEKRKNDKKKEKLLKKNVKSKWKHFDKKESKSDIERIRQRQGIQVETENAKKDSEI